MKKKLLVIIFILLINSCSSDNNLTNSTPLNNDVGLYNAGIILLKAKNLTLLFDLFIKEKIQYPYSDWSARGQMLIGFAHYSNREFDEAILSLSKFTELNPDHSLVPYAIF